MSSLADLTTAGDDSVIPGYTLSKPRLIEIAKAEKHFTDEYLSTVAAHCGRLPEKVQSDVMIAATNDIKHTDFRFPGRIFNLHALARTSLPYLTLWCLQPKHEKVTLKEVAAFFEQHDADRIAAKVYELWGYVSQGNPPAAGTDAVTAAASSGTSSTDGPADPAAPDSPPSNLNG